VLAVLLIAGGIVFVKVGHPWLERRRALKPSGAELQVHVLDVGPTEGDSILIISPGGKSVLIDAGDAGKSKVVLEALKRYKVETLDYFIATHPHPDHLGGAAEVLKGIKVANIIDNGVDLSTPPPAPAAAKTGKGKAVAPVAPPVSRKGKSPTAFFDDYAAALKQSNAHYEKAEPGKKYDLGGGSFLTVLGPTEPLFTGERMKAGGNDTNANSIVLRLDYGEFSMLFMGDAEAQSEERLLNKPDLNLQARVLKVGHHGSKYATSESFVKRVQAEAAIISDGAWNRYGHPAKSVLDRLQAAHTKVYRTDLQGEVTITSRGQLDAGHLYEIKAAKETREDIWLGREGQKDDSSRSGFIAYGDFGPPPKQAKPKR